jgi:NADH-quinone oxidoreductase subunit G
MTDTSTSESLGETEADGVNVTVNGVDLVASRGELVIAAAERHGVYIPRFCYHPRMESVGMCRMCIVEIDTGRGPALQPACMLECTEGMKVATESDVTKKAQDGVLEFLLINHPLDCPVCDKGGECPLQDQTMAYGPGESRFVEEKRHFEKPIPISELVYLDRERCILCDRCTRFAKDVAGDPLIHFLDRGSQTEVNTFPDHPFASYFSGNTVQICPVGALTASTYRFRARPWDLEATESTCQSCSVGCRISIESSRDEVLRYLGVDIDPVNWGWLCDKGRFDFQAVNSPARLTEPIVRHAGADDAVSVRWAGVMTAVARAIRSGLDAGGPDTIAILGGARLTNESAYAWSKLAKGVIGTDNVDAQLGDGLPAELVLGLPRATIDDACRAGGTVIVLGSDIKEELPVLHLRLRHAVESDGVKLVEISPRLTSTSSIATTSLAVRPGEQAAVLRSVLEGDVSREVGGVAPELLASANAVLDGDGPITVVVGRGSLAESAQGVVDATAVLTSSPRPIRFLSALRRGNIHGALDMGLAPGLLPGRVTLDDGRAWFADEWPTVPAHRGMDAPQMLQAAADGRIEVLVLLGADPISDFPDRDLASRALAGARTVIAIDQFLTASSSRADIVLPAAGFTEVPGTATNIEGRVSTLNQRVTPPGTAQADWIIAADLAAQLGTDLHLESIDQIRAEIARLSPAYRGVDDELLTSEAGSDGVVVPLPEAPPAFSASTTAAEGREPSGETDGETDTVTEATPSADPMPPMLTWSAPPRAEAPALDSYSLRLIATRKLYDDGVLVQHSPSLAALAEGTRVAVNPYDFDRIGVRDDAKVNVTSPKATMTLDIEIDPGVPRGCAAVRFNQPDAPVADLIDASARFTDVRLERKDG